MTNIVLIAASGLAREVASSIATTDDRVVGILDDDPKLQGTELGGIPVLGDLKLAADLDAQFLICAGPSMVRVWIATRLHKMGIGQDRFATHVDPTVFVGDRVEIGAGTVILAGCVLTCDITLGSHVVLMPRVVLTHDDTVGDYATLAAGATAGGRVTFGQACYVGMSSSIRQDTRIGVGATLGMGAVLVKDLPDGQTWAGNPAAPLSAGRTPARAVREPGRGTNRVLVLKTRYSTTIDSDDGFSKDILTDLKSGARASLRPVDTGELPAVGLSTASTAQVSELEDLTHNAGHDMSRGTNAIARQGALK